MKPAFRTFRKSIRAAFAQLGRDLTDVAHAQLQRMVDGVLVAFYNTTARLDDWYLARKNSYQTACFFQTLSVAPVGTLVGLLEETDPNGFVPIAEVRQDGEVVGFTDGETVATLEDVTLPEVTE